MYDNLCNRNEEPIALKAWAQNQGPLLAAAVLIILPTFVMFMKPVTSIRALPTSMDIKIGASQQGEHEIPITVWVAPGLVRTGTTDAPGTNSSIRLSGARGETVDSQVVVNAPADSSLTTVNVSASDLTGPGGAVIAASNITLFREYYLATNGTNSAQGTNPPNGAGTYAEPLIPFIDAENGTTLCGSPAILKACNATISAGQNQAYWLDFFIPRGAGSSPAGIYTGTITVKSDQGNKIIPVTLIVWNFELPLVPSEKSLFLFWTNELDSNAHLALLRNKVMPWYDSASAARSNRSKWGLNRSGLDNYSYIGIHCNGSYTSLPTASQIRKWAAGNPSGLSLDFYPADEIIGCTAAYEPLITLANNAHRAGVKILVTIPPVPALYGIIDHWAMLTFNWPASFSGIPGDFWSYASCNVGSGNTPEWMVDYPPINERIQAGFLNQTQRASGILYWRTDNWTAGNAIDSWNHVEAHGCGGGSNRPGDGIFLYPPGPIASSEPAPGIRLKAIRDGIQDYEYVQILNNLGQRAFANSVIKPIATSWNDWAHDPDELLAARMQLGRKLNELSPR
ncbi:MAG TPA: glycoside hydrolase domain-containing protein [Candidatus Saccharimonadales bacterium]|jgi:hypothetical protein|nr:glycoside hydrolase domain-containing protein [Candidatus Saccharimonadales bacterium]